MVIVVSDNTIKPKIHHQEYSKLNDTLKIDKIIAVTHSTINLIDV